MNLQSCYTRTFVGKDMAQVFRKYNDWIFDSNLSKDRIAQCETSTDEFGNDILTIYYTPEEGTYD